MANASEREAPTVGDDYVVVARRYRPQAFDELVGQEHVARALTQAIVGGRIGHAYLFTGARGVGKTSAARIFAKALNCTASDTPTPIPCNACDICRSVSTGDDVDVLEIDGASNRGIDEIRQLRQNAGVRPSRARLKVYIIDEVHMLTKEAFNALLKTLEEPPEHVKFIFATTEPNKIPITILSRCQRFDFAGIESASIQERLRQIAEAEGVDVEAEALQTLALRAAGSMRDSQSLLEQLLAVADGRITSEEVNSLLGIAPVERVLVLAERLAERDGAGALAELDGALAGGADAGQLVDQLLGCYRDAMTLCVGCSAERLLYTLPGQADRLHALANGLGLHGVLAALQVLDQTAARMRVSTHSRTLAEMAVVRISRLEDLEGLAGVVASLRDGSPTPIGTAAPKPSASTPAQLAQALPVAAPSPSSIAEPMGNDGPEPRGLAQALAERVGEPPAPRTPDPPRQQTEAAEAAGPADGGSEPVPGAPGGGLADQLTALRAAPESSKAPPPRTKSRREQLAEVAQNPFVQQAMSLFDAGQDQLRYNPPDDAAPG